MIKKFRAFVVKILLWYPASYPAENEKIEIQLRGVQVLTSNASSRIPVVPSVFVRTRVQVPCDDAGM
jgi:hypothetical protein